MLTAITLAAALAGQEFPVLGRADVPPDAKPQDRIRIEAANAAMARDAWIMSRLPGRKDAVEPTTHFMPGGAVLIEPTRPKYRTYGRSYGTPRYISPLRSGGLRAARYGTPKK